MEKEILVKCIEQGFSQRDLALKFNYSQSNIKYWLKKFNIKTKFNQFNSKPNLNEKFCSKCNMIKPIDEFYKRSNRDGHGGYCKKCSNNYHSNRLIKIKLKMIEYLGNECVDCGLSIEKSHYAVFDFHHIDSKTKDPNFDRIKFQKWDKIKMEIDKCELLCSNCHRLRHVIGK